MMETGLEATLSFSKRSASSLCHRVESILGAATGRGGQGVEVGAGHLREEQGGFPCAWTPTLSSWTRNQVDECQSKMVLLFVICSTNLMLKGVQKRGYNSE